MAKTKEKVSEKEVKKVEEVVKEAESVLVDSKTGETPAKTKYRESLDAYKKANPEAWEIRGKRLLAKLDAML